MAVEQYGAGPFATMHLADLGAEVIKIEDPSGGRRRGPLPASVPARRLEPVLPDLQPQQAQRRARHPQTPRAGPCSTTWWPARMQSSRTCAATFPPLSASATTTSRESTPGSCAARSAASGMTGPRARQGGYDYILQGLCGWMALTGDPDGPPTKSGLSMVDFSGGFVAAIALLTGIHAAQRDGVGMDCDLSLHDTATSLLGYLGTWHLTAGFEPERVAESAHPSLVPFQIFEAADAWLVIGCAKEKFWQRLTEVLGMPELTDDDRDLWTSRPAIPTRTSCWRSSGRRSAPARPRSGWRCWRRPGCRRGPSRTCPRHCATPTRWPGACWPRPSTPITARSASRSPRCGWVQHPTADSLSPGTGTGGRRAVCAQGTAGLRRRPDRPACSSRRRLRLGSAISARPSV